MTRLTADDLSSDRGDMNGPHWTTGDLIRDYRAALKMVEAFRAFRTGRAAPTAKGSLFATWQAMDEFEAGE